MANIEYPEVQLFDFVCTETTITCDLCKKSETISEDGAEAVDVWYREGWRGRSKCYCPNCAKKKLKLRI